MRKLRKKRLKNGLCTRCGKPKNPEFTICDDCRKYKKIFNSSRRKNAPIRALTKWEVKNFPLHRWMVENNMGTVKLAQAIGVSERTVQAWVFEGRDAKPELAEAVNIFVGDIVL